MERESGIIPHSTVRRGLTEAAPCGTVHEIQERAMPFSTKKLPVQPYFDMELFLATAEEQSISGPDMAAMIGAWEEWLPRLHALALAGEKKGCLAVWLEAEVEEAVDAAWKESPAKGFRLNALAQTLCMCAVHELIPEVEEAGCAPAPEFYPELVGVLNDAGLPCMQGSLSLGRRYAVLTPYPFRGGCEICSLGEACPRRNRGGAFSVTLPGHE